MPGTDGEWLKETEKYIKHKKEEGFIIIASGDFHPENHISFSQWPSHCVENTYGSEYAFDEKLIDFRIKKGFYKDSDSYSAFYAGDNVKTELDEILKKNNIKETEIIGLAGEYCVLETYKDSVKFGYNTSYNEKFIKSISGDKFEEILRKKIKSGAI